MPVTAFAPGENLATSNVQGSEQRGGAVANIVVGDSFDIAQTHRQKGLSAIEGLDLALFVHA